MPEHINRESWLTAAFAATFVLRTAVGIRAVLG